jgi:hypothetical protein
MSRKNRSNAPMGVQLDAVVTNPETEYRFAIGLESHWICDVMQLDNAEVRSEDFCVLA